MRATLTTGETIELSQDCYCSNQDGPHWVHANDLEEWIYLDELSHNPMDPILWLWFCNRQLDRLTNRQHEMKARNIAELHYMPYKHWLEVRFDENRDATLVDTRTNTVLAVHKAKP